MSKSDIEIIEKALNTSLDINQNLPNVCGKLNAAIEAVQRIKDGECGLRKILGQALDESEFLEIFVSDKVGNLRDGSQTVVTAYEDGRSLYKKLKENRSQ